MSTTLYHGTAQNFTGTPTCQTDINGLYGIFLTESREDAEYFAEANTEGEADGEARVFTAEVDLDEAEDLSGLIDEGMDHWDIIAAAAASTRPVIILPDLSGVSEREILVTTTTVISWRR